MNIALFMDCFSPQKNGVITSAFQLYDGLKKRGHNVYIVAVKAADYENNNPDFLLFPMITLDFGSKQGFGFARVNKKKLAAFMGERSIDIVHLHTEFSVGFAGKRIGKLLGLPRIATTHTLWEHYGNYVALLNSKLITRTFLKTWVRGLDLLVSPSVKAKRYYETIDPEKPKLIVPNGIETAKFRECDASPAALDKVREIYGITRSDFVFLFVGRIGPEKRIDELQRACIPVMKKHPNVKMMCVGDGPSLEGMRRFAEDQGLGGRFIFTGFVKWDDIYRFYKIAGAFATASLSEVHPMTAIEGIMSALPCIARDDDSFRDLVYPGQNGYLCPTDEAITDAMMDIVSDPGKRDRFSAASLEISKKFEASTHVDRMEKIYKYVLEHRADLSTIENDLG